MVVSDEEKQLYYQAVADVDKCIEDTYKLLRETSEKYDYELEWVIGVFQERFSRRKREELYG